MNSITTTDIHFLGTLPPDVRVEVERWRDALMNVSKPIQDSLKAIALRLGVSYQTARRKYDAFRHSGYDLRVLVNRAKVPETSSALTPEFLAWFQALAEKNQRKTRPAYRKFCSTWKSGQHIPGMDNDLPRHCLPPGYGEDNIRLKIKDAFAFATMRRGLGFAVGKYGPQIFTTRANLWYGSHLMIDDMWHDNFVVFGKQIVRVLELDALDVFSGYLVGFGTKPRVRREDGVMDGLKEKYARLLAARVFFNEGYSPRGTTILAEHGTAAISEAVAKILYDRTGGMIRVRESGMTGEEQAITGWWGKAKGNPRFKAALESIRNLKHNELGDIPAQTGKDREHLPEYTAGMLKDCEDMLKIMAVVARDNPARARSLRLNLLDYHAHFLPLLMDVYDGLNKRDWHNLEGWHDAGNIAIDYRMAPSSDKWLTDAEFSQLPEVSRQILIETAKIDKRYINPRKLSPWEVRLRDMGSLIKLPPFVVGEMLGEDMAFELKVVGAYFNEFSDQELAPEPLLYESVIITPDGRREQLPDGKYLVFANPFDISQLFVHDARKRCLGVAARAEKIDRTNPEQLKRAFGNRARRLSELTAPILERHADLAREETKRREHNAAVLGPSPEEKKHIRQLRQFDGDVADLAREESPEEPQHDNLDPSSLCR